MNDLAHDVLETSWGWIAVMGSSKGIVSGTLPETREEDALTRMKGVKKFGMPKRVVGKFAHYFSQVNDYFSGTLREWDIPLDLGWSPNFFGRIWEVCRTIPYGETRNYRWLAERAGNNLAVRAAGQAMARNPIPLVIPCHRVIDSSGGLHGFGGGLPLKRRLLDLEAVSLGYISGAIASQDIPI